MSINAGEYGVAFNLNTNYALNSATSLTLNFTRQDGTTFIATGPDVTAPGTPLVTTDGNGTFAANQYAQYKFKTGDLTTPGTYTVRLTYIDATKKLISDPASFTVNA